MYENKRKINRRKAINTSVSQVLAEKEAGHKAQKLEMQRLPIEFKECHSGSDTRERWQEMGYMSPNEFENQMEKVNQEHFPDSSYSTGIDWLRNKGINPIAVVRRVTIG